MKSSNTDKDGNDIHNEDLSDDLKGGQNENDENDEAYYEHSEKVSKNYQNSSEYSGRPANVFKAVVGMAFGQHILQDRRQRSSDQSVASSFKQVKEKEEIEDPDKDIDEKEKGERHKANRRVLSSMLGPRNLCSHLLYLTLYTWFHHVM